ncbi:hypothetical protein DERP_013082 [Dermatophagoides pteronyssinus]|uniref:Uncharacterized protein n=1 Tax=Dermatophagoides pteronyssinus TaxID=6956 RepID=A0ABQ8JPW5_DERPT|nr:hypothetical protein DERP_013082 [Dermatophagoides pteronyssinus]
MFAHRTNQQNQLQNLLLDFSLSLSLVFPIKEDNNNNDHFYNILSEIMTIDLFKLLSIQTNKAKQSKEEK